MSLTQTQQEIVTVCDEMKALLLEKNEKYGDSALSPARIFAKSDAVEQIRVRIDDKLSRIRTTGESASDEDTAKDLLGYLVLLLVAKRRQAAPGESPVDSRKPCECLDYEGGGTVCTGPQSLEPGWRCRYSTAPHYVQLSAQGGGMP